MLPNAGVLPGAELTEDEGQAGPVGATSASGLSRIPAALLEELLSSAEATASDLSAAEFEGALVRVGERFNHGQAAGVAPDAAQQAAFFRSLRLADLALATACALGRDAAWRRFLELYRAALTQAAIAITRSATLGEELADSLYAELYGLRALQADSARRSPLASYSGRGSLLGWLRTTLAQRHIDHHRRTYRETPLVAVEAAAPVPAPTTSPQHLIHLRHALVLALRALGAENRFLLTTYFLDQRTLLEIGRMLHVHEATVSRKIKRLAQDLRTDVLRNLKRGGLSARAAEEALGTDPRDLEINLRWLLQTSQSSPFSEEANPGAGTSADSGKSSEPGQL